MPSVIAWLIALISTAICLFLWFRDVRRIMRNKLNTVESAAGQLASFRRKTAGVLQSTELAEVLERSESIYGQAVEHYNNTLHKPWIFLPATLMGFHDVKKSGGDTRVI